VRLFCILQSESQERIRVDNGPKYISKALASWAERSKVELVLIEPGKPIQNSLVERFNGTCRRKLLNANWFFHLNQVRELASEWMDEYNFERPHAGLGRCRICPARIIIHRFARPSRKIELT